MEFWKEVRRLVLTNELSKRGACEKYGLGWHTLKKILAHDEPPGYRKSQPRAKPKIDKFLPVIHQILVDDRQAPKKQRHTAWRIFQRLRDEHGNSAASTRSSRTPCGRGSSRTKRSFCRCRIPRAKPRSTLAKRRSDWPVRRRRSRCS